MLRRIILLISLSLSAALSRAQSPANLNPVRIILTDAQQQPVFGAAVQQQLWSDTTQTRTTLSDTAGVALLRLQPDAAYQLRITAMGYKPFVQGIRPTKAPATYRFTLEPEARTLSAVTIKARASLLRQEDDKLIVNPELLANSSSNAYELLTKTPGLFLDQNGNVYLTSAVPATIYINGREQRMGAEDVATLLRSLPPNSIERIEVMRTPSARYDAASAGGAVNVVLKKGVRLGRTGSVSANLNQGHYGNQGVGFSLNDGNGPRTTYVNLNYSRRDGFEELTGSRELPGRQIIRQQAYSRTPGDALYGGYGLSYQIGPRWELNVDGRATYGTANPFTDNATQLRMLDTDQLRIQNQNTLQNRTHTGSLTQGVSARLKLDSLGSELTADLSYSYLTNHTDQQYQTQFQLPATADLLGGGDLLNRRHFLTAKIDWLRKLPRKLTLEAGLKTSSQRFDSRADSYTDSEGQPVTDPLRTTNFRYSDGLHSGYLQATKTTGKFTLKTGLRIEHTAMYGHQRVPTDTTFQVNRTDLFPYVYLSRPILSIAKFPVQAALIYRRSITRPAYDQLNPSVRYVDAYLSETGNPALQPQFTRNVEANLSVASLPILAVGQHHTQQLFSSVLYQQPTNPSLAYRTTANLGQNRETYFRMLLGIPPGGRYFFVVIGQYSHTHYSGQYDGQPLTFSRGSWTLLTYHQLEIDKRSTLQLNGLWSIRGQQQFYALGNFGSLDLSVNRKFLNDKLLITLSASDLLYTSPNSFVLQQGNVAARGIRKGDSRRVGLSLRYNFGLKKQRDDSPNPFSFDALTSNR